MTTTSDQSVAALAAARRAALDDANSARSTAYDRASRDFVDAVRPIIDAGEMSVDEVATEADIGRVRLYQLLRQYPPMPIETATTS